jgi:hypothetical protein
MLRHVWTPSRHIGRHPRRADLSGNDRQYRTAVIEIERWDCGPLPRPGQMSAARSSTGNFRRTGSRDIIGPGIRLYQ